MRVLASAVAIALGVGVMQANSDGLLDRTTGMPDMERMNAMQNKVFRESDSLRLTKAREADGKNAFNARSFQGREVFWTRSFLGFKNPWIGTKTMRVRPSPLMTRGGSLKNLEAAYSTPDVADARSHFDANKSAPQGGETATTHSYQPRGTAQGAISMENEKISKKMTVQQVRELLNKN